MPKTKRKSLESQRKDDRERKRSRTSSPQNQTPATVPALTVQLIVVIQQSSDILQFPYLCKKMLTNNGYIVKTNLFNACIMWETTGDNHLHFMYDGLW